MAVSRTLCGRDVRPIGFGAMNVSHGYQSRLPDAEGAKVLERALELGYDHIDTAAIYGFGHNETLIGAALSHRRNEFLLASKCGIYRNAEGVQRIDNTPETIRATCEQSLANLRTDVIDLYYLHRWDKKTPIEEVAGTLGQLVQEGKIRHVGLSEVSAATLRRAHAEHPIAALQTEYSLWTRNPEISGLEACRELGVAFVAFSPVARQFLTGRLRDVATIEPTDIRAKMPRFTPEAYAQNLALLEEYAAIAEEAGCTQAQLALAWLLTRGPHVLPIPGTQNLDHVEENFGAEAVTLSPEIAARLDALINQNTVQGPRYNEAMQATVDTEEFT